MMNPPIHRPGLRPNPDIFSNCFSYVSMLANFCLGVISHRNYEEFRLLGRCLNPAHALHSGVSYFAFACLSVRVCLLTKYLYRKYSTDRLHLQSFRFHDLWNTTPSAVFFRFQPNFIQSIESIIIRGDQWNISKPADRRAKLMNIWDSGYYSAHIWYFWCLIPWVWFEVMRCTCKISDSTNFETLLLHQFSLDFNQTLYKV